MAIKIYNNSVVVKQGENNSLTLPLSEQLFSYQTHEEMILLGMDSYDNEGGLIIEGFVHILPSNKHKDKRIYKFVLRIPAIIMCEHWKFYFSLAVDCADDFDCDISFIRFHMKNYFETRLNDIVKLVP